ncbi:MAG: AEC family transporter [Candidatus Liptonbacteria bacterium]|nr:AEC family transporter [Parcubacteria group bacterium]MBI4087337.1 AEC family transporter [Candidatus Liptonbacteria bacterium]
MILEKTLPLIVIFIIGFLLKKAGVLKKEYGDPLATLVIWIVAPAVIAGSLAKTELAAGLMSLPLIAVLAVSSLLAIGWLAAKAICLTGKTRGAWIITFPTLEGGTVGYAVMLAVFGTLGLSRIVLFDFGNALFEFTAIYLLAAALGNREGERESFGKLLWKTLTTPLVLAIPVGLGLNLFHVESPLLWNVLDTAGAGLITLVMLMVALEFEPKISSFKLPITMLALQVPASIFVAWFWTSVFGLAGIERTATFVGICLPTSIMGLVFAKENKLDAEFAANVIALGLPFSLVFLPILIHFLTK